MSNYTLEQLREDGPQFAMAMLLRCLSSGEPFVTYGAIKAELEHQLGIDRIFPTQIGHVAGSLMNRILEIDDRAPLINVLITRATGIPGVGAGGYLADRYGDEKLRDWDRISNKNKKAIVDRERRRVFGYKKWNEINKQLFGSSALKKLTVPQNMENDPVGGVAHGGEAESEEHKRLKKWVSQNPQSIGIPKTFGIGNTEHRLLSGDEVDVMFANGTSFRSVEVKSCRSTDEDLKRGIYQCVKYREVKAAEHAPYDIDIKSILVTERKLSKELADRAKLLNVACKCVSVNKIKA